LRRCGNTQLRCEERDAPHRLLRRPSRATAEQPRAISKRGCRQRSWRRAADSPHRQRQLGIAWRRDGSGESLPDCGVREVKEESGIDCEISGLVGIYTDPKHVIVYTSNGEARQEFSAVFTARATGGEPTTSNESSEVRWIEPDQLEELPMDRSMRLRISHYLAADGQPHLG